MAAEYQSFNLTNEPLELGLALKMEIQQDDIDKILQKIFSAQLYNYKYINVVKFSFYN